MRIGIDCRMYSSHFTGIGRYVFELVENLQKLDKENEYFLFFNQPEFNNFQASNQNFHKVHVGARHYSFTEQTKFLNILNKHNLDLMHFTHFNAPILYKRPSIVTIHDLTLHFYPGKKMTSFIRRIAYNLTIRAAVNKAKKVIAVSRCTAKDLQEILKTPLKKVQVIYEGVNDDFREVKDQAFVKHILNKYKVHKPFLLYTGVWRDHKNLKGLLKAFSIIRQKHDIQLVITGRKDNIYADEIFDTAKQLNLMDENQSAREIPQVIFPGLVSEDELIAIINAADVYVFPSFYEGFGLPPLEAMQCGTPVATSNCSCIPEVCGNNAVYFDPHSPDDMAKQITKLYTDRTLHQRLKVSGKKHAEKYSWQRMARETHQLYLNATRNQ